MSYSVYCNFICVSCHSQYRTWCVEVDEGRIPEGLPGLLDELGAVKQESAGGVLIM